MTTYYVRVSGNDGSAGTSAATAFLTIDKARSVMSAGDVTYVGAGVYRELVTLSASGSSGSQISFIADVTGTQTGDAGLVAITAFDSEVDGQIARAACFNMNGKEFITIRGFTMLADKCIYDNALAGNRAYEGVIIEDCALLGTTYSIDLTLNNGATPASANGLIIRNCRCTLIFIRHTNNASAHTNVKMTIENCECHSQFSGSNTTACISLSGTGSNTFSIGGITIANCSCYGRTNAIALELLKNTSNLTNIYNLYCTPIGTALATTTVTSGAVFAYSTFSPFANTQLGTNITNGDGYNVNTLPVPLMGGFSDLPLYRYFGWSPFLPGEQMQFSTYLAGQIAMGNANGYQPTRDIYGNPRSQGRPTYYAKYFLDASDDAVTDPDSKWTNEANIFDTSVTTTGTGATSGSSSSNFTFAGGTNAPGSGGTITGVYVRVRASAASGTLNVGLWTNGLGESLGTYSFAMRSTTEYKDWQLVTAPTGGWTWAKVQELEAKVWLSTSVSTTVAAIQIAVAADTHNDIGPVETRARANKETSTVHAGSTAANFQGSGFYETFVPVSATSTTITCYARYDSNYAGSLPKLEVFNIPGVADQSDTMALSANTWEQLSVTFTPSAAGVVRVRISSQDYSLTGKCFFDDLAAS